MKQIRISCPSWVIPGTYAENLAFLEDKPSIQNVELLFFIYDDSVQRELRNDMVAIQNYHTRFTYTAHLPDPLRPEHESLIASLSPWVEHFVFHPVHPDNPIQVDELSALITAWQSRYGNRFCAENTKPGWLEALEARLPSIPLCMDTGHLALSDTNTRNNERGNSSPASDANTQRVLGFWEGRKNRMLELHLHSTNAEAAQRDRRLADHRPLTGNEPWLCSLVRNIIEQPTQPLINLELFSWQEVEKSLSVLHIMLNNPHKGSTP